MARNESKVVLFDWGGVVDNSDLQNSYNYKQLMIDATRYAVNIPIAITDNAVWDYISNAGIFELSKTCKDENSYKFGLDKMLKKVGYDAWLDNNTAVKRYIQYTLNHFKYIPYYKDIASLEEETGKRCKIGVLSDQNWLEGRRMSAQLNLSVYDYVFRSYEIGLVKSDGGLIKYVNEVIDIEPIDILLIDDYYPNIEHARNIGWCTYRCGEGDYDGIKSAINTFLQD